MCDKTNLVVILKMHQCNSAFFVPSSEFVAHAQKNLDLSLEHR